MAISLSFCTPPDLATSYSYQPEESTVHLPFLKVTMGNAHSWHARLVLQHALGMDAENRAYAAHARAPAPAASWLLVRQVFNRDNTTVQYSLLRFWRCDRSLTTASQMTRP